MCALMFKCLNLKHVNIIKLLKYLCNLGNLSSHKIHCIQLTAFPLYLHIFYTLILSEIVNLEKKTSNYRV